MKYFKLEESHYLLCPRCKAYGVGHAELTLDDTYLEVVSCPECRKILRVLECQELDGVQ